MSLKKIIFSTKHQLIVLVFLAIGLNINTVFNEYAVDDVLLTENSLAKRGINGIPEILTTDFLKGYDTQEFSLSQPRYRPLSLIVFALEYQFFGMNPIISHLINVLLFALLIVLLFKLLHVYLFKEQHHYLAFITCLLFVVHPVHTEVIANIKSRDELITFTLLLLSLITFFKHKEKRSILLFCLGLICFFLALITRESAVTFILVVPLMLYFFSNQTIKKSIQFVIPLLLIFAAYIILRFYFAGFNGATVTNIFDAPFLFATASQAFATKIFILVKYIVLLIFPYPLSFEYGYNQIPYLDIYSILFVLSLLVLFILFVFAIFTFKNKSLLSFSILYFFITISLASNLLVDIGTPFSERLLFQPSLAYCIVIAAFYLSLEKRIKFLTNGVLLVILILFSVKTVLRNGEWKNNETLYLADVISAPNSLKTNMFALEIYNSKGSVETNIELKKESLEKAIFYGERAYKIYPKNPILCMNLGSAYFGRSDYFKAADLWLQWFKLIPANPEAKKATEFISSALYKQGNELIEKGNRDLAIKYFEKSIELDANNTEAWYNLGGNYFYKNDTINATKAWENVKMLDPYHSLKKEDFSDQ